MDNADDWKQKYYQSLEKLEQLEDKTESWEKVENLLRLAMNRVAVAAQGMDAVLDKHLNALRSAVRQADYPSLEGIIDDISSTVKRMDEQRQRTRGQFDPPPQLLIGLLEQLRFPKQCKKRLKTLHRTLKALDETEPVDAVLREFAALVNDTLHPQGQCTANTSHKNLMARFFGGRDQTADLSHISQQQSTETVDASDLTGRLASYAILLRSQAQGCHPWQPAQRANGQPDNLLYPLRPSSRLDVELNDEPGQSTDNCSSNESNDHSQFPSQATTLSTAKRYQNIQWGDGEQKVIANFCLRLLEALHFPETLQEHVQALRDMLTEGFDMMETGSVIQKIADLITATRVRLEKEKQELQQFLHHLTDHLRDIDHQLSGAENSRQANLKHNLLLNTAVEEQVSYIESSVKKASELDHLKTNIQQHLLTIRRHFEEHRRLEEQQQQALEQALERSNTRLQALEQESQQLKQRLTQEHQQAICDSLTGVFNRLAYEERMEQEYARWKRYHQPLVLVILDIDHFKKINDHYGHKAGDKALKLIAKTLQSNLRESDFLARFGGEEFVVLMPQTELSAALGAANKLREAVLANQFHYQQKRVHISISCGATQFRDDDTIDNAFQRADQALYKAKQLGRNRCEGC